jgi:cation:H+ antiporter
MTRLADMLADRTGLGEAVIGGVLLGASTSLSGTVTSVSAAAEGLAPLAVSNAIGGICAQTVFLVIADLTYRQANLEHAAADEKNLLQVALLVLLLSIALAAYLMPPFAFWAVHPVSILLVAAYLFGVRAAVVLQKRPMWRPEQTEHTRFDQPDSQAMDLSLSRLLIRFGALALVLGGAGFIVAETGAQMSTQFGISQTVVGALLTATATSLPELVTTLAAVQRGALQLAVGGIVGGNTFDVLFLSLSDFAYRDGSIYHAMGERDALLLVAGIIMAAILLMGLILRTRRGIGFEGLVILLVYSAVVILQIYLG